MWKFKYLAQYQIVDIIQIKIKKQLETNNNNFFFCQSKWQQINDYHNVFSVQFDYFRYLL